MYKLMIIDDEKEIQEGIKNIIQWDQYDICISDVASNGEEALEKIHKDMPHIILVDIRMPIMSGLELLDIIKKNKLNIKAIILSSYDDFNYAKQAIALGACEYLLKPCRPNEILSTVLDTIKKIDEEKNKQEKYNAYYNYYKNNLSTIKNNFFTELVSYSSDSYVRPINLHELNMKVSTNNVTPIVISYNDTSSTINEHDLTRFAVYNISDEIFSTKFSCDIFTHDKYIVILANFYNYNYELEILPILKQIKSTCKNLLKIDLLMGVGTNTKDILHLGTSYRHAITALNHCFLDASSIMKYDQNNHKQESFDYPYELQNRIMEGMFTDTFTNTWLYVDDFIKFISSKGMSREIYLSHITALLNNICSKCTDKNILLSTHFSFKDFYNLQTFNQIVDSLKAIIQDIYEDINHTESNNLLILKCVDYIKKYYFEEITLDKLASTVYVSSGYLSQLFKQELGVNFIDYLHKMRIKQACLLLKDISLKTYYIAEKVGYSNEKYFSTKFKKYMHMTPTQYRNSL